ncbi:immunity 42 family protein [Pararobbsia silviterrae]|nr:immunity 42 family protein [Pararobbsia silviterrae]
MNTLEEIAHIGDKNRFAVTLKLDKNYGDIWLFGRICYWIGGDIVGDYNLGTSLRDVLIQSSYIRNDSGKRFCPSLANLEKDKIFSLTSNSLLENSTDISQYTQGDPLSACFDVRIPVDVFDSWKIFLVEDISEARMLYKHIDSPNIREFKLTPNEFDNVFCEAYIHLEKLYDIENEKHK